MQTQSERTPPEAALRFHVTDSQRTTVRQMIRRARSATLATSLTMDNSPLPYASLVTIATDYDGTPLLLLSGLADHTRALAENPHCCLLIEEATFLNNPQTGPRVSLMGRAVKVTDPAHRATVRHRFLARHPSAALYADFADFSFWRLEIERAHFVGGFARAVWMENDFMVPTVVANEFCVHEQAVVSQINSVLSSDVNFVCQALLPLKLIPAPHAAPIAESPREKDEKSEEKSEDEAEKHHWTLISLDPDGCLMRQNDSDSVRTLLFPHVLASSQQVLPTFSEMAEISRQTLSEQAFRRT